MVKTDYHKAMKLVAELEALGVAVPTDMRADVERLRPKSNYHTKTSDQARPDSTVHFGSIMVPSDSTSTDYRVTFARWLSGGSPHSKAVACTCPHFRFRGVSCKHMDRALDMDQVLEYGETVPA